METLQVYTPPDYDVFNISNGTTLVGTSLVPLTYEGTPSSTIGSTPVGLVVPEDLILRVSKLLIQNVTSSPITVQLIAQLVSSTGSVLATVAKTPPIPVNANSVVSLDVNTWDISVRQGFNLYAQSSVANSANVYAKCYFVKGSGSSL